MTVYLNFGQSLYLSSSDLMANARYASKKCEKEGKLNIKRRKICPSDKLNKRNMNVLSLEGIIVMNIFLILF